MSGSFIELLYQEGPSIERRKSRKQIICKFLWKMPRRASAPSSRYACPPAAASQRSTTRATCAPSTPCNSDDAPSSIGFLKKYSPDEPVPGDHVLYARAIELSRHNVHYSGDEIYAALGGRTVERACDYAVKQRAYSCV